MAPPSILGAVGGGYISGVLPAAGLLAFIAAVLYYSSYELFRWEPPRRAPAAALEADGSQSHLDVRAAVFSGAVIGLLGGIVGLILGSLRMPALIRFVRETPARAAGTNVTIGFCVGVAGALGHLASTAPDWTAVAVGGTASIPGALLGSRLTGRLSERQLVRAIAAVLLVAATATALQAAL